MSIEDRRKPIHGGLTAAIPAADILASHTPYLHKVSHFLSIKGVMFRLRIMKSSAPRTIARVFFYLLAGGCVILRSAWADCSGEQQHSANAAYRIEQEWPLRPSQDIVNRYLQTLGERLVPRSGPWLKWFTPIDWPSSGWRFFTVRDSSVNAFSIGDGRTYITEGSFHFVNNEAELAAILAHEMGHQLAGHFCLRSGVSGKRHRQIGTLVQVIDIDREIEADAIALDILQAAGFPPDVLLNVIDRLPVKGDEQQHQARLNKLSKRLEPGINDSFSSSAEFFRIKRLLSE